MCVYTCVYTCSWTDEPIRRVISSHHYDCNPEQNKDKHSLNIVYIYTYYACNITQWYGSFQSLLYMYSLDKCYQQMMIIELCFLKLTRIPTTSMPVGSMWVCVYITHTEHVINIILTVTYRVMTMRKPTCHVRVSTWNNMGFCYVLAFPKWEVVCFVDGYRAIAGDSCWLLVYDMGIEDFDDSHVDQDSGGHQSKINRKPQCVILSTVSY